MKKTKFCPYCGKDIQLFIMDPCTTCELKTNELSKPKRMITCESCKFYLCEKPNDDTNAYHECTYWEEKSPVNMKWGTAKLMVNDGIDVRACFSEACPQTDVNKAIDAAVRDAEYNDQWAPLKFEGEYPINGFGISTIYSEHFSLSQWLLDTMECTVSEAAYLILIGIYSDVMKLYFSKPIILKPYTYMKADLKDFVKFFSHYAKPITYIGFMGYCVGKRWYLSSIAEQRGNK